MLQDQLIKIFIQLLLIVVSVGGLKHFCSNISQTDSSLSTIESFYFDEGQYQSEKSSCSWFLPSKNSGFYQISLRKIEFELNSEYLSNELIFKTNNIELIYNNPMQRYWRFSASYPVEIEHRSKNLSANSNSLNIRHFRLEWIYTNNVEQETNLCEETKYPLPVQWKCNCQYECMTSYNQVDTSDEVDCSICSLVKNPEDTICRSDEYWCLPNTNTTNVDSVPGVCLNQKVKTSCLFSSHSLGCNRTIVYSEDSSQRTIFQSMIKFNEHLCIIIMPKRHRQIQLIVHELVDLDVSIYDGDRISNPSSSPGYFRLGQYFIHNRLAMISIQKKRHLFYTNENKQDRTVFNVSWSVSNCPENQMACNKIYEEKCYTKQQRCDGFWDCIGGDDELGCSSESCPNTFSCNDRLRLPTDIPRCYTWQERCNGFGYCTNRMDERFCSSWSCNSQNGTFLCHNRNCIYEVWRCDGQDDCGDNSDERNCPAQIPRRIMTSIVIGITICSTLFVVALACSCKLYHLRMLERRASIRFVNPQTFVQRQSSSSSNDSRRMAPPSYNQTMGFVDENEERYALLTENLRLAGLADMITIAPVDSSHSRRSRRSRRQRTQDAESNNNSGRLIRQLDLFRSLFNHSNDRLHSNEFEINEHAVSHLRELPPDYVADSSTMTSPSNHVDSSDSVAQGDDTLLSARNQPKQRASRLMTVNNDDNDDEALPTNSDDDKLLIP